MRSAGSTAISRGAGPGVSGISTGFAGLAVLSGLSGLTGLTGIGMIVGCSAAGAGGITNDALSGTTRSTFSSGSTFSQGGHDAEAGIAAIDSGEAVTSRITGVEGGMITATEDFPPPLADEGVGSAGG
jgi:hypothetical protein